jgi:exopolysaccharide production protein ExoY
MGGYPAAGVPRMSLQSHSGRDDMGTVAEYSLPPMWSRENERTGPVGGAIKRSVDVVVALFALLLFLPLFAIIAALIKWWDRGPVFYVHKRIGYGARPFACLKFRTMVADGDEVLRAHLRSSPAAAQEWAETRKLKSDPRVTELGMILRKSSIDELPQLINVLRGDMSLVGPRPIVPDEAKMYGQQFEAYLRSRPGLTGPWQISGRNDQTYANRVSMDCHYVEHWSLWRDVVIIVKTVPVLLTTRGSY